MKPENEPNEIKKEPEALSAELNDEELEQVTGGRKGYRGRGHNLNINGVTDGFAQTGGAGFMIPTLPAVDKKGDIILFKIDGPAEEEADVVELNIANVSLSKGETLVPAEIEIEED